VDFVGRLPTGHWPVDTVLAFEVNDQSSNPGSPYAIRPLSCLSVCLSVCLVCPVCITLVHCGQTVGRINVKLGKQAGLGPGDIVLDGDPAPLPKEGGEPPSPQFSDIFGRRFVKRFALSYRTVVLSCPVCL